MFDCFQYSAVDNLITKKNSEHLRLVLMFINKNIDDPKMKKFLGNFANFLDVPCKSLDGSTTRQFIAQLEDDSVKEDLSDTVKSIEDRLSVVNQLFGQEVKGNQNTPVVNPGVIHNLRVINYNNGEASITAAEETEDMTDFLQKMEVLDFLAETFAEENVTVADLKSLSREQLRSLIVSGFKSGKIGEIIQSF